MRGFGSEPPHLQWTTSFSAIAGYTPITGLPVPSPQMLPSIRAWCLTAFCLAPRQKIFPLLLYVNKVMIIYKTIISLIIRNNLILYFIYIYTPEQLKRLLGSPGVHSLRDRLN